MKTDKIKKEYVFLIFASILGLLVRCPFGRMISGDMNSCLLPWYREIARMGIHDALTTQVGNYNLLYQNLILVMTRLPGDPVMQYKLLSVFFDYVLAFGVYFFVKKTTGVKQAAAGYLVTLLLPTVWLNSVAWGQCDSIYVALIIWSLYFVYSGKNVISFIFLGLALSFKLQTVFIFPFYGYLFLSDKRKRIRLPQFFIIPAVPFATAVLNFTAGRPVSDIVTLYLNQTGEYRKMFLNYPSIWSLLGLEYGPDKLWTILVTFLILCFLMYRFYKKQADVFGSDFLRCALILSYTCVLFLPSMHERYGYLYEILAVMLALCTGKGWAAAAALQLISLKTYLYFLYGVPIDMELLGILNTAVYIFVLWDPIKKRLFEQTDERETESADAGSAAAEIGCVRRLKLTPFDKKAMLIITAAFFLAGSMHLGSMKAPETSAMFGTEKENGRELYVSLGEKEYVDSVCIYQKMTSLTELRIYYAKDGEWVSVGENLKTGGVFSWKKINIGAETHQICILIDAEKAELAEIICFGKGGKLLRLTGVKGFGELTDEQDTLTGYPTGSSGTIFDEVYHARTAYEFLNGLPIYENTHPPLGKSIISAGIALFGMNPFGWRIMSLLFGTMLIPVMYLFGLRITGKSEYAAAAAILQATEFMNYTLSRIGTIDIFAAFFVVCMFYGIFAFLQEDRTGYLAFSGAAFAFGAATKWTAFYAAPAVALLILVWIIRNCRTRGIRGILRFIAVCFGCYVLFPAFVYVISYIPFAKVYTDKTILQNAVSNSINMLNYHQNAMAAHPYSSVWYTWPFDLKPLLDSRVMLGEYKSTVATFVNPFICYCGAASLLHNVYLSLKKDRTSMVLILFYICMLLPWVFIKRTVFIYQYFICTKILILLIVHSIRKLHFKNEMSVLKVTAGISGAMFAVYLPVISGIIVKADYLDKVLRILPGWLF